MLETAQVITSTHDVFRCFAYGYGDLLQLASIGLYWFNCAVAEVIGWYLYTLLVSILIVECSCLSLPDLLRFTNLCSQRLVPDYWVYCSGEHMR